MLRSPSTVVVGPPRFSRYHPPPAALGRADWENALELHMIRLEAIHRLRREFGLFWAWKVPATVSIRLRRGPDP